MKGIFTANHRLVACALVLATAVTCARAAAPAVFTYDAAGNTTGVGSNSAAPSFIAQPLPQLITSNSIATFSVVASGPGLSYQWLSNGIAIAGANGDSLVVGNLPLIGTNFGGFSVIVSNTSGAITSAPAALWSDANANGIPDWWELHYFGNLNQPALADYDGDGVNNLNEYLEGTNPTNRLSFNPRLYLQIANGSGAISVSPDLPYFTMGQVVTLTAVPDPGQGFTGWSGAVIGSKSPVALLMATNESVQATFGFPLGEALENTNLVWTTSGDELWFGQADYSEDGVSAAQSGSIVSFWNGGNFVGDQTTLQTAFSITQPEQIGFWWDVSSQPPDGVAFSINSNLVATLSGQSVAWQYMQTNLAAGAYTLTWRFSKGPVNIPNGIPYTDAAWVGNVTLGVAAGAGVAPVLDIQLTGPSSALLSWPVAASGFTLQQSATLNPANWTNSTYTITVAGTNNQVTAAVAGSSLFYRLFHP